MVELVFKFSLGIFIFIFLQRVNKTVRLLQTVLVILNDHIAKKCELNHLHLKEHAMRPKPDREMETKTNRQVWTSPLSTCIIIRVIC